MHSWHFFCDTFGCKVNQYETESVREAWTARGGSECSDPSGADIILVNSCAITSRGERDARNALVRLRREAPEAILILTGCAARLVASFVPRKHAPVPSADLIIVPEHKDLLTDPDYIGKLLDAAGRLRGKQESRNDALREIEGSALPGPMPRTSPGTRAYPKLEIRGYRRVRPVLKVEDGCTHRCTYCIVPQTRGMYVSRSPEETSAEADRLFRDHAEIMISGINLGQYGRDRPEWGTFWDLLAHIEKELAPSWAGRRRFRISSLEPSQLKDRALSVLAASRLAAPHLHISLQHASQRILRRMGRGHYSVDTLLRAVEKIHGFWPVMGLGCDIIVGFPGEEERDVEELCRFLQDSPMTYAHVFPYSRRPGTPAASFPGQIPRAEKLARAAAVRGVVAEKARAFWESQLERGVIAIIPDAEAGSLPGLVHGVNEFYVPCFLPAADYPRDRFTMARPVRLCAKGIVCEPLGETQPGGGLPPR